MKVSNLTVIVVTCSLLAHQEAFSQGLNGFFQGKGKIAIAASTTREKYDEFYFGDKKTSIKEANLDKIVTRSINLYAANGQKAGMAYQVLPNIFIMLLLHRMMKGTVGKAVVLPVIQPDTIFQYRFCGQHLFIFSKTIRIGILPAQNPVREIRIKINLQSSLCCWIMNGI